MEDVCVNVRKILIVGGGSSGWMIAAMLSSKLADTEVTLIEASDIPILGVGESTNATMKYFLRELGYDEGSFMRACDASFKIAIRFAGFKSRDGVFYHPFGRPRTEKVGGDFQPGVDDTFVDSKAVKNGRLFSRKGAYSYQLDAGLLAEYLKQGCLQKIRHIVDRVEHVKIAESGGIAAVCTKSNGELAADLYIDCTGFRSALLGEALKEPFESCGHLLLNDRAVAAQVPYVDKERELVTHTNCAASSAGWIWSIPLWSRMGMGYVYSSRHISSDEAQNEFIRYLGEGRSANVRFNHLKIRTGRHTRAWVKNCVAIGVSFGFLEPLESTGLSLTQISILDLLEALRSRNSSSVEREMFNVRQRRMFDSTRDFILAHYLLTSREDTPYWREVRNEISVPDSLAAVLQDARVRSYRSITDDAQRFYQKENWNCILSGMGFFGEQASDVRGRSFRKYRGVVEILKDEVFDGEYAEAKKNGSEWIKPSLESRYHPSWYPTW
jgi:tryptophan 6-halogenase